MIVDVHAHLDHVDFKNDLDKVIQRAKKAGVTTIITNGVNPATNRISLELAKEYDVVEAALGIYPVEALAEEVKQVNTGWKVEPFDVDEEIRFIEQQAKNKSIAAIGEIGLDDYSVKGALEKQIPVFEKLLEVAKKHRLPVIVHSRAAEEKVVGLLEKHKMKKIVLHCFNGSIDLIKRAEKNGYCFSIPPIINRIKHFQELVKEVNISRILTETDAPYLGPYRGKRNEPAYIAETIKFIAKLKNMTEEETKNVLFMNYRNLFAR